MTKVRRPYSRVYWEVIDDPKFADVWDDDRAVASWLRLLVAADMAWPASASLYHGVNRASLDKLCRVGLVDMQTGGRYRIHGLDKEREARSRQASDAAAARWDDDEPSHPAGNAAGMRPHPPSNPPRMPSQDKQSREEQSQDEPSRAHTLRAVEPNRHGLPHLTDEAIAAIEAAVGRSASTIHGWPATELDRLLEERPGALDAIPDAMARTVPHPSWAQFVQALRSVLEPMPGATKAPAKGKGFNPTSDEAWDAFGGKDVA